MLTIVPTPIGNLKDISQRAIEALTEADYILAEDTRTTGKLLKLLEIENQLRPFHAFNEHKVVDSFVQELKSGANVALVSDAGTPAISDPGYLLIKNCVEEQVPLTCLPGANAFLPALVCSGLPADKFFFEGFLPHKKGRQTRWLFLAEFPHTFILYESPHRLIKCLEEIVKYCGEERLVCVAREISKMYEEFLTDTVANVLENYKNRQAIKGEIVIVVEGKKVEKAKKNKYSKD